MIKRLILITSLILVTCLPASAFWPFTTRSDLVSYYAPCWGENNKIYFIKKVTFGQAVYRYWFNAPIFWGDYLAGHTELYLCLMNYDGTNKKEIVKLGDSRENTYWLPMQMDYCLANNLLLLSGGSIPSGGASHGIYSIRLDGTEMRKISDSGWHASWSPNGKRIVYQLQEPDSKSWDNFSETIWVMNSDGSNKYQISREKVRRDVLDYKEELRKVEIFEDESPIWSPKGDLIAFVNQGWIWVMKPDGTERKRVVETRHLSDWSPDGTKIMTDAGRGIIDLNGNTIKEIWASGRWSPDGKLFLALQGFHIYTIDGKELERPLSVGVPPRSGKYFVYKKPNNIW